MGKRIGVLGVNVVIKEVQNLTSWGFEVRVNGKLLVSKEAIYPSSALATEAGFVMAQSICEGHLLAAENPADETLKEFDYFDILVEKDACDGLFRFQLAVSDGVFLVSPPFASEEEYFSHVQAKTISEWEVAHPNYCKHCLGRGYIHEQGGYMTPDYVYDCDYCLFDGKCPHCGSGLELCVEDEEVGEGEALDPGSVVSPSVQIIDGDAGHYVGKCACGWVYGAEGLPCY